MFVTCQSILAILLHVYCSCIDRYTRPVWYVTCISYDPRRHVRGVFGNTITFTYNYVIRTNKMHKAFISVLIKCLRHVSSIQVFILREACTHSFMVFILLLGVLWYIFHATIYIYIYIYIYIFGCMKKMQKKLHIQVFLRINTWMIEIYWRHCK